MITKLTYTGEKELGKKAYLSNFNPDELGGYFYSSLWTGSDYSGCSVTRANYNVVKELPDAIIVTGDYWTYSVIFPINCCEELKEILQELENYPVIDDDELHQVEQEAFDELWESSAKADFADKLEELNIEVKQENLLSFFYALIEDANEEIINETGNTAYVDIDAIFLKVKDIKGAYDNYTQKLERVS